MLNTVLYKFYLHHITLKKNDVEMIVLILYFAQCVLAAFKHRVAWLAQTAQVEPTLEFGAYVMNDNIRIGLHELSAEISPILSHLRISPNNMLTKEQAQITCVLLFFNLLHV